MRRVGVNDELRGFGGGVASRQRRLHFVNCVQRNTRVFFAIQAQHWGAQRCCHINRVFRRELIGGTDQAAIPGHASLHRPLRRVQPGDAPAPAKASYGNFGDVTAVGTRPFHRAVQIRHHLRIRHFIDDFGNQFADFAVFGGVALACVQFAGNRQVTCFGKAAAGVGNVLVHAKNLLHHQHHREIGFASRHRVKRGYFEAVDFIGDLAGFQAI